MGSRAKKKARTLPEDIGDEDRVSRLTDELLHKIMSFVDAKVAVQTSVLSRRWKLVWTSLPFLTFGPYMYTNSSSDKNNGKFIRHVLSKRNHQSRISELNFCVNDEVVSKGLLEKFVKYAISHNVQSLTLDRWFYHNYKLSTFSSKSLEKLKLNVQMEPKSDCWDLPALTTLHLRCRNLQQFPYSLFTCLPALTTLCLIGNILPSSFTLTTLHLSNCTIEFYEDHKPYKLSTFSSKSLEKLTLSVNLEECKVGSDYWDLPALTTLHLKYPRYYEYKFNVLSKSWLNDSLFKCLPSLRTLCLYNWDLSKPSFSFSLPAITTLRLSNCELPKTVWDFPALTSLQLDGYYIPEDMSDIFSALVNLQNLTLFLPSIVNQCYFISCPPQLLNLSVCQDSYSGSKVVVSASKLCNFTSFGIITPTIGVPNLENVNIRLQVWFQNVKLEQRKKHYRLLTNMLPGLGNAKNLTFDLETIEALNEISYLLGSLPSPFGKLKYVKLPKGFRESSISSALRSYLLGGSPKATIVTEVPQNEVNHQAVPVSMTSQKAILDVPFATPTDMNSVVHADRVRQIGSPFARTSNERAISFRGDGDFGLWHGHEVNAEFVGLLDLIMKNYPHTFEHFTAKSERFHTLKLNMLCNSVNEFLRTSMTEFNTDIIIEYRDLFADLQRWGFNVVWLVSHLHYVEQLLLSQHEFHANDSRMDDAKNRLQELQTHCLEKIKKIQKGSP